MYIHWALQLVSCYESVTTASVPLLLSPVLRSTSVGGSPSFAAALLGRLHLDQSDRCILRAPSHRHLHEQQYQLIFPAEFTRLKFY